MSEAAAKKNSGDQVVGYFGVLKETRKEYWGIQAVNVLDSTVFFAILTITVVGHMLVKWVPEFPAGEPTPPGPVHPRSQVVGP